MVVPEGFHVEVFASEPMVRQPVTACFDERGRAWVIEYLQYPQPGGPEARQGRPVPAHRVRPVPGASPARPSGGRPDQDPRGHRRRRQGRQGHGLRGGAEPGDGPGGRPRRGLRRAGALPALLSRREQGRQARRRPQGLALGVRPAGRARDGQLDAVGARRLALRRPGEHGDGPDPRHRVPARHLALSSPDRRVRALRRRGREHLGARLRQDGQRLRQQQRLLHRLPHGAGGVLRQGVRQARPLAQSEHVRLLPARSSTGARRRAGTSPREASSTKGTPTPTSSATPSSAATCCRTPSTGTSSKGSARPSRGGTAGR